MSYRLDLDELATERLITELRRRGDLEKRELCIYCEHPHEAPSCKMAEMHKATNPAEASQSLHEIGDRNGWDASRRMQVACAFVNSLGLGDTFRDWLNTRPR